MAFNALHFSLALIGALSAHVSVNVLNDYFDYKSGIDLKTIPTPLSGGSGILRSGLLKPESVYRFGLANLIITFLIGMYFVYAVGWLILPVGLLGIAIVYFYTPTLTKMRMVSELGAGLFALMVVGTFYTQTARYSPSLIATSLIPGLLIANLLLLNEFPDVEADRAGGRKHIPIMLGRKRAAKVYVAILCLAYVLLLLYTWLKILPVPCLLGIATLPLAVKASKGVLAHYDDIPKLIPCMIANVQIVLGLPLLITFGLLIATFNPLLTVGALVTAFLIFLAMLPPKKG
jgi:1,4-dihydroxy-2-naphthoate octaprenyltransferase